MGIDLALNTYYYASANNNVSTNSAGLKYKVTRTAEQSAANKATIIMNPYIYKTVNSGAWLESNRNLMISCGGVAPAIQPVMQYNLDSSNGDPETGDKSHYYYFGSSFPFKRISGSSAPFTFEVDYNPDGTRDNLNLYVFFPMANSGTGNDHTVNINVDLPANPRNSILSDISAFNIEDGVIVSYTPYTEYSNKLDVLIGETTIISNLDLVSGAKVDFSNNQIVSAIMPLITEGRTIDFIFALRTMNGETQIGVTSEKIVTGKLAGNIKIGVANAPKRGLVIWGTDNGKKRGIVLIGVNNLPKRGKG